MKVMKFGGTSVGSVNGILSVKKIVEAENEPVIVVVSALSGITDQLYKVSNLAVEGNEEYLTEYQSMLTRHIEVVEAVVPAHKLSDVVSQIKVQFNDLANILRGIYNDAHDHDDEEGEEGNNKLVHHYAYINGVVIDVANISRIELDFDYNPKKNKNNYFIRIVKKYPSPLEEEYIIPFNSEEERDKGYDVLRAKLKLCNVYIV
jgi:hypothetical protein